MLKKEQKQEKISLSSKTLRKKIFKKRSTTMTLTLIKKGVKPSDLITKTPKYIKKKAKKNISFKKKK